MENKFINPTGINVDMLPVCHSNNKFGGYYRSHRIKVKDVGSDERMKDISSLLTFRRIFSENPMCSFSNIRVNGQPMAHVYLSISNNSFDLLIDQSIINEKSIQFVLVLLFMIGK